MDRRERAPDLDTVLLAAMQGHQAEVWTALPAIVKSWKPSEGTCECKPTLKARLQDELGNQSWVELPLLVDCPVIFPGGGGFTLTFPLQDGDEVLVVFASRCIDAWWQSGGVQLQAEMRMHNLSDGFVIPGPRSKPRTLSPNPSEDGIELRNDARTARVRIDAAANIFASTSANATVEADGDVYVEAGADLVATAAGTANVTAPAINLTGNVTITGNLAVVGNATVSGTLLNAGTNIGKTHIHTGGTISGNTGAPT